MRRFRDLTTKEKIEYLSILFLLPFAYIGHLFRKANFRTLPKRAVAVCLAVVMIAVMLPTTAFAADTHTHCICGKTHKNVGDHAAEVSTTFTAVTDQNGLQNAATNGGSVYLANDITINAAITVTGELTLCLNGKTLKNTATNTRVIHIDGGTLNLTDCGSTGTITGGSITGNGGGVYNQGTFAMYGGKITGNTANIGGGVYVLGDGFIMYGGEISNNTAKYNGGGVYNARLNTIIAGGSIKNNTANESPSGGIYMNQSIMLSGNPVISGNKYGSNDGYFDIYKNYTAIQVTEDFAPTGSPITVSVDPSYNDRVFLEAVDSGVDIEKYIGYFDYVSEFPLYKKDGKYYAGFAIVEEPTGENNYTVKVNSDKDLSCQWYKEGLASKVLTDRDLFLMDGAYDPISQSFTISDWGLTGDIILNPGDQLIVSSQSEIDAELMGVDGKQDGNTYTFTVTRTDYYMLWVAGDSGASVKLTKNGSDFVEVEGQTELTLDTSSLEEGEYQCKLVWDLGTEDPDDDIEAWSEIVSYTIPTYTVTWKNHDGSVLETDTGVVHGTAPAYNGATPGQPEDENFTYTFNGWSPALEAVTGDAEYTAQFTAVSKRVDPTYTVTIPATVNEGESFAISASGVVLNTNEKLTVTLQSDFKFRNEQGAELGFKINDGAIVNNAQLISVMGNGDKNNPLSLTTENLVVEIAEEAKYSGTYQGTITFTIAVNTAENN
ncbi:MAG: hypothetical protein U0M42_06070 [Acutalibacteraceae bacterium]|nr:hypothetical protein [Acutalibacteraceae bacterium]